VNGRTADEAVAAVYAFGYWGGGGEVGAADDNGAVDDVRCADSVRVERLGFDAVGWAAKGVGYVGERAAGRAVKTTGVFG